MFTPVGSPPLQGEWPADPPTPSAHTPASFAEKGPPQPTVQGQDLPTQRVPAADFWEGHGEC